MNSRRERSSSGIGLRWFDSLQFKLGLMFVLLVALLGAASFRASRQLVGDGLNSASFRYESEVSRRLSGQIAGTLSSAHALADWLVITARDPRLPRPEQKALIESAAERLSRESPIVSFGIWPEPTSTAPGAVRDSQVWVRDSSGKYTARADYNDPDTIPYWREAWYTPARLIAGTDCYWSPRYRDLLTKLDVVSCTRPLLGARGFEGAVTVTLDLATLNQRFVDQTAGDSGYAFLSDRGGQVLALSRRASEALGGSIALGRTLAELAQKQPEFNPLVLAIHGRNEAFLADSLHSSLFDARQVSRLIDNTREMSRNEADATLAAIWNQASGRKSAEQATLQQVNDPVLGETGYAVVNTLPETEWQLASVTPTREGQDSARYLITQALVITLGAVALTLLLAFIILRGAIVVPLRRMLERLEAHDPASQTAPLTIDQSARNELGALAYWFNERSGRIRELAEQMQSSISQLSMESAERQRAQDLLTRVQERSHLALTTIDDGVITIDELGHIEDMNPVAEQLLGVTLRNVRGTPFAQSFRARVGGVVGTELPNLTDLALERGSRIEYPDGVFLSAADHSESEIYLAAAPLHARNGRAMGCVVVLRRLLARLPDASPRSESTHPVTGLGGRNACERRVRRLIDGARADDQHHALLKIDVRIPEDLAQAEDVERLQLRIIELLGSEAGGSEQLFSLASNRYGVTVENADTATSVERAHRMIQRLGQIAAPSTGAAAQLEASVGVVMIDASLGNAMEVIRRAGAACDAAARAGGGHAVLYDPALEQADTVLDDSVWVQRIRRGLDTNQFHLTTQWLSPLQSHAAEGQAFEMMVALEDEEGFWASSDQFLPVAERHLMAGEIDHWVIRRVLDQLEASSSLRDRVAFCMIELSATTLANPSFVDFLAEQINAHPSIGIDRLCMTLRADHVTAAPQQAIRFCEALRRLGCRIALDHQTGRHAPTLDLLRRLSLDFEKIDARRFANVQLDPVEQTAADAIHRLVQVMRHRLIVCGIESEAVATAWRRIGADYLQGQAMAKATPVPFSAPH